MNARAVWADGEEEAGEEAAAAPSSSSLSALRADYGLREDAVVLACMNRPHKVGEATFEGWLRVLARTTAQRSMLWMLVPRSRRDDVM